jgi:hypothetical protein
MESTTIKITLPIDRHINRIYPLPEHTVRMPNEILEQVIQLGDLPSRKIFYIVLAMDHLKEPERTEYEIDYLEIYESANNAKKRGKEKREKIKTGFQEKGFNISTKFVTQYLGKKASEPYINAFTLTDYVDNKFTITLSKEFKLYLHVLRKYNDIPFTTGDLNLLLNMYHRAADKLYWLIRSHQFVKGTHKYNTLELKERLGYPETETRNFCSQTLESIRKELEGTWAEFSFEKIKKGKEIRELLFAFDKDEVIVNKLKNDLRFAFEVELQKRGFNIKYIHYIRHLILKGCKIKSRYWDAAYVLRAITAADSKKSSGKIKEMPAYLFEALFNGYFVEGLPEPASSELARLGVPVQTPLFVTCPAISLEEVRREAAKYGRDEHQYKTALEIKLNKELYWVENNGSVPYLIDKSKFKELEKLEIMSAL